MNASNFDEWLYASSTTPKPMTTIIPSSAELQQMYDNKMMQQEATWFDLPGLSTTNTMNTQLNSETNSSEGSPIEQFSSLFDSTAPTNAMNSLANSMVNSLANSPVLQQRNECLDLATIDELELNGENSEYSSVIPLPEDAEKKGTAGQKKKRAPRKRLTPHQKQAHNKIEKRYRININTKIAKLQQIIPWVSHEKTAFETGENGQPLDVKQEDQDEVDQLLQGAAAPAPRLNKSMILEKAVDYILYLQNNEKLYEEEIARLKKELEASKSGRGVIPLQL